MNLQPWLWSNIRIPTPADWVEPMTVCLVSHCFPENKFVSVVDSMLSTGDMSADKLAIKSFAVGYQWTAMFSANDLSPVSAIRNDLFMHFKGPAKLAEVIAAFQAAFRKELLSKAENSILASFAMTVDEFKKNGLAQFGPEIFARLFYRIEQISLDATFLVYGFDENVPHIFTIQNKGEVSHYDQPGFWAIGSGQTSALGTLFSLSDGIIFHPISDVLFMLCKAKFNSESALGVGKFTTAMISTKEGRRINLFNDKIEKIKEFWTKNKGPDLPIGGSELAKELLGNAEKEKEEKKLPSQ